MKNNRCCTLLVKETQQHTSIVYRVAQKVNHCRIFNELYWIVLKLNVPMRLDFFVNVKWAKRNQLEAGPKLAPISYALNSSNVDQFSNLFNYPKQMKICNKTIAKDPTTPQYVSLHYHVRRQQQLKQNEHILRGHRPAGRRSWSHAVATRALTPRTRV